jgi:hypothetical protein
MGGKGQVAKKDKNFSEGFPKPQILKKGDPED